MNFRHLVSACRRAMLGCAFLCLGLAVHAQNTVVRIQTTQGSMDMTLLDSEAPITVANFLAYLRGGDYVNVMFHRNAWNATTPPTPFVIQSGGFSVSKTTGAFSVVPSRGAIQNEFSATRSNVRGTVAMAKVQHNPPQPDDPNSATSQWFVNMGNNTFLDSQNGGFTVFARLTTPGLAVADRIAALPNVHWNSPFDDLPLQEWIPGQGVYVTNLVLITDTRTLTAQTSADRIFNYLEALYPQYLEPPNGDPGQALGYTFRHYSGGNVYVGIKDDQVWYLVPWIGPNPGSLGSVADWLAKAQAAGY
jgi:peptidyl-prolyl cis-trans isomerase A (cyclophilin A)